MKKPERAFSVAAPSGESCGRLENRVERLAFVRIRSPIEQLFELREEKIQSGYCEPAVPVRNLVRKRVRTEKRIRSPCYRKLIVVIALGVDLC